jgi:fido (protein-threonine AMPylation protein)
MTPPGQIDSELSAAHPFLKGHGRVKNETIEDGLNAGKALYLHGSASWKAIYFSQEFSIEYNASRSLWTTRIHNQGSGSIQQD